MATATPKPNTQEYIEAVGRRRQASARVRLYPLSKRKEITIRTKTLKKGDIIVNDRLVSDYFPGKLQEKLYQGPLVATNTKDLFAVSIRITGGGVTGQLEAAIHGIARALDMVNTEYHTPLKKRGFLTRDPRKKERRKAGHGGKARAKKQSPKR